MVGSVTDPVTQKPDAAVVAPARPEGLPDAFFDAAAGVKWKELLTEREELTAFKAADEARRAGLPADPSKYELKLPEGFALPDGVELNADDARLPLLREFAHKEGWSQAQFAAVVALDAKRVLAAAAAETEFINTERNKLGANREVRVDKVIDFVNGVAKTSDQAKAVARMLRDADSVEFFERVIEHATSQGVSTFQRGSTGDPPDPAVIAGWDKMSVEQKLAAIDARKAA